MQGHFIEIQAIDTENTSDIRRAGKETNLANFYRRKNSRAASPQRACQTLDILEV
jgi:hypothetical protein